MTQPEKHAVNSLSSRFRHVYWVEATKPRFSKGTTSASGQTPSSDSVGLHGCFTRPRHSDATNPHLSPEQARQSVEFAEALGTFLFVLAKRVERGMAEAKKEPTARAISKAPPPVPRIG
jgi:hypothetical protein